MKPFARALLLATAVIALLPRAGAAQSSDPGPLLKRMAQVNAKLQSYTARAHVDIALHSFPFVSPSLDGTYYYRQPDKQAVVFDTVPALAQQFQKVYPRFDPPSEWASLYAITVQSDQGGTTLLRMVPRKSGRVEHLDVKVDDASATPIEFTWSYVDGGSVTFAQQYSQVQGNYLVKSQSGKVDFPSYKADVTSTFTGYKLNVAIPDTVFQS